MSARSFKIFAGVLAAHLAVLSLVWVGFPVPLPRPPATFIYQGALPAGEGGSGPEDVWPSESSTGPFELGHFETSRFNRWTELRDLSKPSAYDRLGF